MVRPSLPTAAKTIPTIVIELIEPSMIFEKVSAIYANIGWEMTKVPDDNILSIIYGGQAENWTFVVTTDEANGLFVMFARAPFVCPADKMNELGLLLEKANFNITHGAWVMDRSDGEVRFRLGIDLGGIALTKAYIKNLTAYTNLTMEHYLPALRAIVDVGRSAVEAMEMVD